MQTGFELFELTGLVEIEPLYSFKQNVRAGTPIPVRFLHGDHAIIGGTSDGRVNVWDIHSRRKQPISLERKLYMICVALPLAYHYDSPRERARCRSE